MVNISLRVLSKPDHDELPNIYKARAPAAQGCWLPPHMFAAARRLSCARARSA